LNSILGFTRYEPISKKASLPRESLEMALMRPTAIGAIKVEYILYILWAT